MTEKTNQNQQNNSSDTKNKKNEQTSGPYEPPTIQPRDESQEGDFWCD